MYRSDAQKSIEYLLMVNEEKAGGVCIKSQK